MRVLALDYGSARCGTAVCDPTGIVATPLEPILAPGTRRGRAQLRELVARTGAEHIVIGLPLTLSGTDSAQTREARAFAEGLAGAVAVPVELYDERFTTRLAQRDPGRASEDSRAAAHLLESWLAAHGEGVGA